MLSDTNFSDPDILSVVNSQSVMTGISSVPPPSRRNPILRHPAQRHSFPFVEILFYLFFSYVLYLAADRFTDVVSYRQPSIIIFVFHAMFLYIHEGGHFLFSFFGRTLHILGGSFWQVMFPFLSFLIAIRDRSHVAAVSLFLTGFSLMDVSVYIRDARDRALPLLGGDKARHDWYNLLLDWQGMDYAQTLADIAYYGGLCVCVCAIGAGFYFAYQTYNESVEIVGWARDDEDDEKRFQQFIDAREHHTGPASQRTTDHHEQNTFE